MLATDAEWPRYRPAHSVEHHLSPDDAIQKSGGNGIALDLVCEADFAEAIAQQTAEQRLSAAMADGPATPIGIVISVWRPDDVEPWPQLDVPNDLAARLFPDLEPSYPEPGLR